MSALRQSRKNLKLSQKELARLLHVDQTSVSKWELGRSYPDIQTALKISDLLRLSLDVIYNNPLHFDQMYLPVQKRLIPLEDTKAFSITGKNHLKNVSEGSMPYVFNTENNKRKTLDLSKESEFSRAALNKMEAISNPIDLDDPRFELVDFHKMVHYFSDKEANQKPLIESNLEDYLLVYQITDLSMAPKLKPRDLVIVKRQAILENKDLGLISINQEPARFYSIQWHKHGLVLLSYNEAIPPIYLTPEDWPNQHLTVWGKAIEIRRKI